MVFMGDQSLPTGYKRGGGTVENDCHFIATKERGVVRIQQSFGGGGYQVNFFVSQPNSFNERKSEIRSNYL